MMWLATEAQRHGAFSIIPFKPLCLCTSVAISCGLNAHEPDGHTRNAVESVQELRLLDSLLRRDAGERRPSRTGRNHLAGRRLLRQPRPFLCADGDADCDD